MITAARMHAFHVKRLPKAARMLLFAAARGIAPSRTPWGHMYLQKYGSPSPVWFMTAAGSIMTAISRTAYFKCLRGFIFFVENFLDGILCSSS